MGIISINQISDSHKLRQISLGNVLILCCTDVVIEAYEVANLPIEYFAINCETFFSENLSEAKIS